MQTRYDRCPNCMQALSQGEDKCPHCGFDVAGYEEKKNCLKPFTVLQNKYMLGRVIGVGGFGITYLGFDLNLQTYIAIKEYFPDSFASRGASGDENTVSPMESKSEIYNKGLTRYVEEARNLSKFYNLQGIVSVKDFFYENGTGYIVMEFINGINLKEYLKNNGGTLPEQTVLGLMKPVFESLFQIHNSGLVHRDISPDNIMVDKDGKIKLIDFGSARGQSTSESDKTYTVILKHGYAPSEQYYAKGKQGAWTDIYSLCATMYKMLTGQVPPNSVERMEEDTYVPVSAMGIAISQRTEMVLAKGLAVRYQDRYQNIGELLNDLYGNAPMAQPQQMPQSAPTSFANPASGHVSGNPATTYDPQSMYLNPATLSSGNKQSGSNKKIIGIIAGSVAAVALVVGLVIAGGKKKPSSTESTTTEVATTTEAGSTEAGTTENSGVTTEESVIPGAYAWPTEVSDDWQDYTVNLDGTIMQFPMPYSEFKTTGWKTDNVLANVAGGEMSTFDFYNDNAEMTFIIANFGLNEASANDCYVIGFEFDASYDDYQDSFSIELSGGVKFHGSSVDEIKSVFGAPDYIYEGTDIFTDEPYTSIAYAGDDEDAGYDFELNDEKGITAIRMVNTKAPEGASGSISDLSTDAPAINDNYTAPTGASTDRLDSILSIDGAYYRLPVPFSEFEANGWKLDNTTVAYMSGNAEEDTKMEKDGQSITITLKNYTPNAILPKYAIVTEIEVMSSYCNKEVIFPGGLSVGDAGSKFEQVYSDLGDNYGCSDYSSFVSYHAYQFSDNIVVNATADPDTGLITDYTYKNTGDIE